MRLKSEKQEDRACFREDICEDDFSWDREGEITQKG